MAKNWFRVATEGATTDGRKISREWIEQMAKNFDPNKYGARVWMEHMRGLYHDGPFAALGDVLAVKAEEVEDKKLALFVQIDPTERLKEINKERQKVYSSIEVDHDFAGTGEAYLVGLAVTDSPASLGTEMLKFSAQQGEASPLAHRKQRPSNVFTAAVETQFDFEEPLATENQRSLLEGVKALFKRHADKARGDAGSFREDLEKTLEMFVAKHTALEAELAGRPSAEAFSVLESDLAKLQERFDALYTRLDNDPDTPPRTSATGDDGDAVLTDC